VSLNIKNERTHALVRELAALTGMSQTSAVEDAVRRRLDEVRASRGVTGNPRRPAARYTPEDVERRRAAVERIAAQFRAETTPEQRAEMRDHGDWLYDEWGLPK
jgi:antitoxin VapB